MLPIIKFAFLSKNQNFGKHVFLNENGSFSMLTGFSGEKYSDTSKCIFILQNETSTFGRTIKFSQ